jgi:hypothetical protein
MIADLTIAERLATRDDGLAPRALGAPVIAPLTIAVQLVAGDHGLAPRALGVDRRPLAERA